MNPDILEMNRKIAELENKINNLYRSSTIERSVETALAERLGDTFITTPTGVGVAGTQNINLSGSAETIVVPAQPSGTLTVTVNGVTYNLLYA